VARFLIVVDGLCRFFCQADESVLAGAERSGMLALPVGCRRGGCGVCRIRVISGRFHTGFMSNAHVTAMQAADGFALACRTIPLSDLVIRAAPGTPKAAALPPQLRPPG
jgi:3-phenylpropionate/trans-cinnamate dioxygenase ferredoxin reductase subunit